MFLSAPMINPLKLAQAPDSTKIAAVAIPVKTWTAMSAFCPPNAAAIAITVYRDYSSAPAEVGISIERVSDGYHLWDIQPSDDPNSGEHAALTIVRPVDGWDKYKIYNNAGSAGKYYATLMFENESLYS
ncbi:hypothetical protein NVP1080O_18 [Vibrio phage 1.080.O._10N.286.48.A4]|uniref:Uncharacterized protein n=2 Tax=Autolykiviridae TaxID=2184034 RepID=A0A2I7QWG3_9VIRU|nr:hypothetical protein KMD67_gp18 [Vibrio phage 1.080.O._10N.286.48.A4]AUR85734.1 hypothetical protein NVP1080O_18 [Vibrio phage 1.080.O._10N.286.48.A4]AUR90321.1 hypothetical protein NVP1141A_18 [Vibrio phage 1.141.A._10N.261.49.B3]